MMVLKTYISKKSCLHHAVIQVLFIICLGVIGCRRLPVGPSDDTIASGGDALPLVDDCTAEHLLPVCMDAIEPTAGRPGLIEIR